VIGNSSGSCPITGFFVSGDKTSGSATSGLVKTQDEWRGLGYIFG